MLEILYKVEEELPHLLRTISDWNSLDIDYHPPRVERMWRGYNEGRIYLHALHPCTAEEALLHPHSWPSAMRIISGIYEMGIGYSTTNDKPLIAARTILPPTAAYEMTEKDGWHYVRPLGGIVYTLMVTGAPWKRDSPKSNKPLTELSDKRKEEILEVFLKYYD